MDHRLVGAFLGPLLFGIYYLIKRQYYAALGAFTVTALAIPLHLWLRSVERPSYGSYVAGAILVVVTALEIWYLRRRKGQSHNR